MSVAGDTPKKASRICASCQKPATKRCTGCLGAPVYDETISEPTFYCSATCQKADWCQHKSKCRKLQTRKTLNRAALLLQAIFYRIRLHALPFRFKSARIKGSIIYIEGYQCDGLASFPVCLNDDRSLREAVLVYMGCTEAMMYLHKFAKELLKELCSKIEDINASVIRRGFRISAIRPNGDLIDHDDPFFHDLYRVTLKNGEKWAIDTTGAQCGYADPLCPWHEFEKHRSSKINREYEFGYIRYEVYQPCRMFLIRHLLLQKVEKQELAEALEEKIPTWAEEHGGKLNSILIGSDSAFMQAKTRFLDQVEDHLKVCMTKMYTPEQIVRRSKEIEGQIIWHIADSN